MNSLVPLGLSLLGVIMAAAGAAWSRSRARRAAPRASQPDAPRYLVHAINDDRCTGCEACITACPTNVLSLISHKSRPVRFEDCVQCEACARVCPTTALVMHTVGAEPPAIIMAELDESFQTTTPGQYLIGEVAGKPLVKNAANMGRFVVEHMLGNGLVAGGSEPDVVDVAIVGSGPGGISAALTCIHHRLSYVVLEKEQVVASTVSRYPRGKAFMAEPSECRNLSFLPVYDTSKEELVATWQRVVDLAGVEVRRGEAVEKVAATGDGRFDVVTTVASYRARRVVLATGTRGKPRTLGVPGENLAKVASLLEDPAEHAGRAVLVVGGGDSALEAAHALGAAGARVTLAYRGRAFTRAQKKNRDAVAAAAAAGRVEVLMQCNATAFTETEAELALGDGTTRRIRNDAAFVLIGADLPVKWLGKVGVSFVKRPHSHQLGATDALLEGLCGPLDSCPASAREAVLRVRGQVAVAAPPARPSARVRPRTLGERVRASVARRFDSVVARLRPAGTPAPRERHPRPRVVSDVGFDTEPTTIVRAPFAAAASLSDELVAPQRTVVSRRPPTFL